MLMISSAVGGDVDVRDDVEAVDVERDGNRAGDDEDES